MNNSKNTFLFIILPLTIFILIVIIGWLTGNSLITNDEFLRIYTANSWRVFPTYSIVNGEFLPGHAILHASALNLYTDLIWTPRLLNLLMAAFLVFLILKRIYLTDLSLYLKFSFIIFLIVYPVGIWLSSTPLSEIPAAMLLISGIFLAEKSVKSLSKKYFLLAIMFFTLASFFRYEITMYIACIIPAWAFLLIKNGYGKKSWLLLLMIIPLIYCPFHLLQRSELLSQYFHDSSMSTERFGKRDALEMSYWFIISMIPFLFAIFNSKLRSLYSKENIIITSAAISAIIFFAFFTIHYQSRPNVVPDRITYLPFIVLFIFSLHLSAKTFNSGKKSKILSFLLCSISVFFLFLAFNPPAPPEKSAFICGMEIRKNINDYKNKRFLVERSDWGWTYLFNTLYPAKLYFDRPWIRGKSFRAKSSSIIKNHYKELYTELKSAEIDYIIVKTEAVKEKLKTDWKLNPSFKSDTWEVYKLD